METVMARPVKCRRVDTNPLTTGFNPHETLPAGSPNVVLTIDEFEALRLADYEGRYQVAAAKRMRVSRQTFGNIVASARKKVADALVNVKAIKIEGGRVKIHRHRLLCPHCRKVRVARSCPDMQKICPECGCQRKNCGLQSARCLKSGLTGNT
jgi:uncharacterized protein